MIKAMCGGAGDALAKKIYMGISPSSAQLRKGSRSEATRAAQKRAGIVRDLDECVGLIF
jgi:hypothetical protein